MGASLMTFPVQGPGWFGRAIFPQWKREGQDILSAQTTRASFFAVRKSGCLAVKHHDPTEHMNTHTNTLRIQIVNGLFLPLSPFFFFKPTHQCIENIVSFYCLFFLFATRFTVKNLIWSLNSLEQWKAGDPPGAFSKYKERKYLLLLRRRVICSLQID